MFQRIWKSDEEERKEVRTTSPCGGGGLWPPHSSPPKGTEVVHFFAFVFFFWFLDSLKYTVVFDRAAAVVFRDRGWKHSVCVRRGGGEVAKPKQTRCACVCGCCLRACVRVVAAAAVRLW